MVVNHNVVMTVTARVREHATMLVTILVLMIAIQDAQVIVKVHVLVHLRVLRLAMGQVVQTSAQQPVDTHVIIHAVTLVKVHPQVHHHVPLVIIPVKELVIRLVQDLQQVRHLVLVAKVIAIILVGIIVLEVVKMIALTAV